MRVINMLFVLISLDASAGSFSRPSLQRCLRSQTSTNEEGLTSPQNSPTQSQLWSSQLKKEFELFATNSISCEELLEKIPLMVWMGDSSSKNYHAQYKNLPSITTARNAFGSNLFFDQDNPSVLSFFEQVSTYSPVFAVNLAAVGSNISTPFKGITTRLIGKKHLSKMIDEALALKKKPNYIGIWLGHNDLNWPKNIDPTESISSYIERAVRSITENYLSEVKRLVSGLTQDSHRHSIMLYGQSNVSLYATKIRSKIEAIRQKDPLLYPEAEAGTYLRFSALRSEYRTHLADFHRRLHVNLAKALHLYISETTFSKNIHIEYSDALTDGDWENLDYYHPTDGWHLSNFAKNDLAARVFESSKHSLQFIGVF